MLRFRFFLLGVAVAAAAGIVAFDHFAPLLSSPKWVEQAKLVSDTELGAYFGQSIAIDGNTAVVGEPSYYIPSRLNGRQGAVFIYNRPRNTWLLQAKLLIPEVQAENYNSFGSSVAIDGDTVLIAASGFASAKPNAPLYVFTRKGGTWTLQAQLALPKPPQSPIYYTSVALDKDTAVAGADGKAHVFRRKPATGKWSYEAELKVSDGTYGFGKVVAISGSTIIIGGHETYSSNAHVFVRDPKTGRWSQQAKLSPGLLRDTGFGAAVAISDNTIVVGAPKASVGQGTAYVFGRNSATGEWSKRTMLSPNDVPMFLRYGFGASVAVDGNTVVVGTTLVDPLNVVSPSWNKRGVYVFQRHASTGLWLRQAKLLPKDYDESIYGKKVSISNDQVIVSAPKVDDAAAYIFRRVDSP